MSDLASNSSENLPDLEERVAVKKLQDNGKNAFVLKLDDTDCGKISDFLGLLALRKVRFEGEILALEGRDWQLKGKLGASAVQSCVVSSEPVNTRIDVPVSRIFLKSPHENAEEDEIEFDGNDESEALGAEIDLGTILIESLTLALPDYPRQTDVTFGEAVFAPPGIDPIRDEDTKPFASLAALRDKLDK